MNESNLRTIDLNLLVILDVLLEEKHITNAAKRMNISQSAMSKAFLRIRATFDDPILIRMPNGYELTDRANELIVPVKQILREIHQVIGPKKFDPLITEDEFTVSMLDYAEMMVGSAFMQSVIEKAPKSKISIVARTPNMIDDLANGAIDITFGLTPTENPKNCVVESLLVDQLVCVVDEQHPLAKEKITLEAYLQYPHAIQTTGFGVLLADKALSKIGHRRHVAKESPNFVASILSLRNTNMILSLPQAAVTPLMGAAKLVVHELPFNILPMTLSMIWHKRNTENASHKWFREMFKNVVRDIQND
jgi:DNA-binding transcriptional LysR family regulator